MLGTATHGVVEPKQIVWEPSRGVLSDLLGGRRVLFAGAPEEGAPRDIFRALVRLTPDGRPISIRQVRNITETPKGDDTGLLSNGRQAAFSTVAFGSIQSVTVLEPEGIRSDDRPPGPSHRAMLAVTSWQETGTLDGIGRADIRMRVPAVRAEVHLSDDALEITITGNDEHLVYNLQTRKLDHRGGSPGYAAKAQARVHREKPMVFWAVDTVRAEVGPEPIAWLENQVFGAKDQLKQLGYRLFSASSPEAALKAEEFAAPPELGTSKMAAETWPPPPIPSLWKEPR
jgi:hypothetical protein